MNPTRRNFLAHAFTLAGAGFAYGPGNCRAASSSEKGDFSFSLLGDIHYDRMEHHDFDWVKREKSNSLRQIENYSRITKSNLPVLFQQVKNSIKASECSMVVQIGDLVQGLCGNRKLARKHCEDAVAFVKEQEFGVPFFVTKGNHDITGPGSIEAYDEIVVPFIGESLEKEKPHSAHFTQEKDNTLFVYFDAYHGDSLGWFENLMENHQPEQRVIFVVHPPVVPYNARSTWTVFGNSAAGQAKRQRLMNLLGKHRAIVLCGHLHKYSLVERSTEFGSFTQLAISSVAYHLDDQPKDLLSGLESYGSDLVDLEPGHSPETIEMRRAALTKEKPDIRRFDFGNFWGHAVVRVSSTGVEADIYRLLEQQAWKTVRLGA